MEKICKNCEYFVWAKTTADQHPRGRCMNPQMSPVDEKGRKKGVFKWANGTCIDFKPRQKPQ